MPVPLMEDGAYFYVYEPDGGAHCPKAQRISTRDGRVLSRRRHGYAARVEVADVSDGILPIATLLRAAAAVGRAVEHAPGALDRSFRVRIGNAPDSAGDDGVALEAARVREAPVHHPVDARVRELLAAAPTGVPLEEPELRHGAARRVLFFESLMNSDMPHNDCELSQGVLHMASTLSGTPTRVALADVKMSITGTERPVVGLDGLRSVLAEGPVDLVCITLLEGYFDGVVALVAELRKLGCRAHVAVGGVMPTLTPEHVACHLPDVTFVCRGAGEWFVPRLAAIVGDASSIEVPLTAPQVQRLLALDGLFSIDRAGRRLVAANPQKTVRVESLDAVELDLGLLERRHLERGIEVSTSRGCIHKCSFCSIIGRQSYQARSSTGVLGLLEKYEQRYREIFGSEVPRNAYRLHVSDDDFACDRQRAREFLQGILATPFRLSSVQVSVADLCARVDKQLVAVPDPVLFDAIRASCFADSGASIPERDFVLDHKSRAWSAYLQIGVETFSDRELDRLGKGYGREHVRVVVDELAARRIHVDAYLILANSGTRAEDLVDSLEELCRLKLRHPKYFHVRFPVVPRLVSYFPSASHRRLVRRGQSEALAVRHTARVESHPEFDYPFVEADVPEDPWVRAIDPSVLSDEALYTRSLEVLAERFRELAGAETELSREREHLVRRLDDLPRRLVFETLARRVESADKTAVEQASELLGPKKQWLPAFRRWATQGPSRLVVIPTWQCELRCVYCYIPKQDGRVMDRRTLERSIELLLSTDRSDVLLQFFGGEALVEWQLVQHGIEYGLAAARRARKNISFIVSSNGWSLDDEKLAWLAARPVKLELSLDGAPDLQNLSRPARLPVLDSYQNGIAPRAAAIVASGLPTEVIMVVVPKNVGRMAESFFHIASLGFRRVQINFALGVTWRDEHKRAFAEGLHRIGQELGARWARGEQLSFVNLEAPPFPVRLNGEVTVDFDGTIYAGNGFLHENEHKEKLVVGRLDDLRSFDRYFLDGLENDRLLELGYPPDVMANNWAVGKILASFVRHMQSAREIPRFPAMPFAREAGSGYS